MKWAPRNVQLLFWHGCAYVRNIHGDVPTASCLQRAEAQLSSKRGLGKQRDGALVLLADGSVWKWSHLKTASIPTSQCHIHLYTQTP